MNSYFVKRECCPACRSEGAAEFYRKAYTVDPLKTYLENFYNPQGKIELEFLEGAEFILMQCDRCGLVYQQWVPCDFLMTKLYEEWIDPVHAQHLETESYDADYYLSIARELEMVCAAFRGPTRDVTVLDFGMGWGQWCLMARAYGCRTYGTELSRRRIEFAQENGTEVIDYADISKHQFHFINTEQVFEHIAEPLETLRNLVGSLRDDGLLKISVPNGWDVRRLIEIEDWAAPKCSTHSLNCVAPLEHINCFDQNAIETMAACSDLEPTAVAVPSSRRKTILDISVRDILRPIYHQVKKPPVDHGSTYLFFRKASR